MFLGMRGTGDWVADQRPLNWRQNILYLYPNGMAPLTAVLSMMSEKKIDDAQFHWWTEQIGSVSGAVTNIFTTPDLSVAYTTGGVVGDVLYIQVAAALAARIRAGHQILLRDASDYTVDVNAKVVSVVVSGANSVLAAKLLEDDDNSTSGDLSDCDNLLVIGNINPEGGEMPNAIALDPTKHYNYTQIFRSPLSITRTARLTRLRTGDDYQKAKRECLEMHSIELELAYIWGVKTEFIGDNGKPERTTAGIIPWIKDNAASNVDDYTLNTDYSSQGWTTGGETWLKAMFEQIFRYGAGEKLALVGSGALLGIDALASGAGHSIQNLQPGGKTYGLAITKWITPFGVINMLTHPLFSFDVTTRNMMLILEPKELEYKYVTDTTFYGESSDKKHPEGYGQGRIDGTIEEYLTECGLEFGFPLKCGLLNGVGLDNTL